jgi:hypothetical protein
MIKITSGYFLEIEFVRTPVADFLLEEKERRELKKIKKIFEEIRKLKIQYPIDIWPELGILSQMKIIYKDSTKPDIWEKIKEEVYKIINENMK